MNPLQRELEIARRLAREAGAILMDYYKGETEVEWKGVDDPVTAADHAANRLLVDRLREEFPDDAILSEELPDDGSRLGKSRVWMVDPMDGTRQFIEGIGEFAVQIGLSIDGVARVGVVYHAVADRTYFAASGIGSFVEERFSTRRLRVSSDVMPGTMTAAMSRSHSLPVVELILARLGVERKMAHGSVGLKFGLLAEGLAHIYIHPAQKTSIWDTCGPEAILREAGGVVTDINGDPLRYDDVTIRNLKGIVASNGVMHDRLIELTGEVLRESGR